jgi:simple sugar transport system permease protein
VTSGGSDATTAARPPEHGSGMGPSVARRLAFYQRAGGAVVPFVTALLAFLIGGIVVLITGHNPLSTYRAIFNGTGLNWFFPWVTGLDREFAASNLQQTLIVMTPLMLTGLAVAFAFRCGMFNIGGQGQYLVGAYAAILVGSSFKDMNGAAHIFLAVVAGSLVGAAWGGIAGILKATVGAHEVITTIMLNWIAIYVGEYFYGLGGPLQGPAEFVPISDEIAEKAHLPVFWGDPELQGLHIGFFIAIGMLVVYWVILNRTTLGYEVRAVGFNPEAARYGGISVKKNYFLALAISGAFAGLAGTLDILGWQFHMAQADIRVSSQVGFIGIAVALLGRNTPFGVFVGALVFAALYTGTSTRQLDPTVFDPKLATNLALIIQGLVVLFVGADVLVLYIWNTRKKLRRRREAAQAAPPEAAKA